MTNGSWKVLCEIRLISEKLTGLSLVVTQRYPEGWYLRKIIARHTYYLRSNIHVLPLFQMPHHGRGVGFRLRLSYSPCTHLEMIPNGRFLKEHLPWKSCAIPSYGDVFTKLLRRGQIACALHRIDWSLVTSQGDLGESWIQTKHCWHTRQRSV